MWEVAESTESGAVVLHLRGRLDASSSIDLEQKLGSLSRQPARRLVLEISGLDYISSAGLRLVLMAAKQLRTVNGTLAMVGMQPQVKTVFELAGVQEFYRAYPTLAEAVA